MSLTRALIRFMTYYKGIYLIFHNTLKVLSLAVAAVWVELLSSEEEMVLELG